MKHCGSNVAADTDDDVVQRFLWNLIRLSSESVDGSRQRWDEFVLRDTCAEASRRLQPGRGQCQ